MFSFRGDFFVVTNTNSDGLDEVITVVVRGDSQRLVRIFSQDDKKILVHFLSFH